MLPYHYECFNGHKTKSIKRKGWIACSLCDLPAFKLKEPYAEKKVELIDLFSPLSAEYTYSCGTCLRINTTHYCVPHSQCVFCGSLDVLERKPLSTEEIAFFKRQLDYFRLHTTTKKSDLQEKPMNKKEQLENTITELQEALKKAQGDLKSFDEEDVLKVLVSSGGLSIYFQHGNIKLQLGFINSKGYCYILSNTTTLANYKIWKDNGCKVSNSPVEWKGRAYRISTTKQVSLYSQKKYINGITDVEWKGRAYRISTTKQVSLYSQKKYINGITEGCERIYFFGTCVPSIECHDPNIQNHTGTYTPIIF